MPIISETVRVAKTVVSRVSKLVMVASTKVVGSPEVPGPALGAAMVLSGTTVTVETRACSDEVTPMLKAVGLCSLTGTWLDEAAGAALLLRVALTTVNTSVTVGSSVMVLSGSSSVEVKVT